MSPSPTAPSSLTASMMPADLVGFAVPASSGPVAHLDRIGAARHLDDRRRRAVVGGEVRREAFGVDGGRGDDDLELGSARAAAAVR